MKLTFYRPCAVAQCSELHSRPCECNHTTLSIALTALRKLHFRPPEPLFMQYYNRSKDTGAALVVGLEDCFCVEEI